MYVLSAFHYSQTAVEAIRRQSLTAANELQSLHRDVNQTRLALAVDQAALQSRIKTIAAREQKAKETQDEIRQWRANTEIASHTLGRREKALDGREEAMSDRLQALGGHKQKLEMDQAAFDQVRLAVEKKERELDGREHAIKGQETAAQIREQAIAQGETALRKREEEISEKAKELGNNQVKLQRDDAALQVVKEQVQKRKRELVDREDAIKERETTAKIREADIKIEKDALSQSKAEIKIEKDALSQSKVDISGELQEVNSSRSKLQNEVAAHEGVKRQVRHKERQLNEREINVQTREGNLDAAEAALNLRIGDLDSRESNVASRETAVASRVAAADVREQRVERDEREVVQHKSVIKKRETDVQLREGQIQGGFDARKAFLEMAASGAKREHDDQAKRLQAQTDELRKLESETAANERLKKFMDDVESRGRSMITDIETATKKVEAMSDPLQRTTSTIQGLQSNVQGLQSNVQGLQSNVITNLANDLTVLSDRFKDALRLGERRSEDVGDDYSMDRTNNERSVMPTTETSPGDKRKASQDLPASERQRRQRRTASTFGFRSGIPSTQSRETTRFSTVGSPRNETATPSRSGIDLPRESRLSRSISRIPVSSRQASTAGSSRASMSQTPVDQQQRQQRQAAPVDRRAPQVTLTAEQQWYWDQFDIPGANDWSIDDSKVFLEFLQSKWTHNKKPSMDLIDRAAHNNGELCPTADSRGSGAKLFGRTTTNACNPCASKNLTCWRIQYVNPATARRIYNPTYYAQVVNQGVPPKRWVVSKRLP